MKPILLGLSLLLVLRVGSAQQSPADDVAATRRTIRPTVAKYRETITVAEQKTPPPNVITYGDHDAVEIVICGVSAEASFIQRRPGDKKHPLGDGGHRVSLRRGGKTYNVIESGGRGMFGKQPSGEIVPIAAGLEVDGLEIGEYCKLRNMKPGPGDTLVGSDEYGQSFEVKLMRDGKATLVQSVTGKGVKYTALLKIDKWIEHDGMKWPKRVELVANKSNGEWFSTRVWDFIEFMDSKDAPFVATWKEGATVKDGDTNIVYMMKNGKLVPDPDFMKKTAEETTQRRLMFLGCFVIAGGGISYWVLKRRRATTDAVSGA